MKILAFFSVLWELGKILSVDEGKKPFPINILQYVLTLNIHQYVGDSGPQ